MANVSRVNGFKPVKHLNGSPYNGQANIYEVPAGETIPVFIGDLVVLSSNAPTSNYPVVKNIATVTTAANYASAVIVGAVVGIINSKQDVDGKMTTGSVSLDVPYYRPASTKQYVLVADSPDLIFEAQSTASVALADIGMNVDIAVVDFSTLATTTGASPQNVASTAPSASATRPLQIVGFSTRVDNEPAGANNKVLVKVTTHAYGNAVAGV